jgi:nitroreductase
MLIDLLRSRRSIRAFSDQPVEQEKLDLLTEATLRWRSAALADTCTTSCSSSCR